MLFWRISPGDDNFGLHSRNIRTLIGVSSRACDSVPFGISQRVEFVLPSYGSRTTLLPGVWAVKYVYSV